MTEHYYSIKQRTGPAPKIKKLGALQKGMETTPVIFKGEPLIVESMFADEICPNQYITVKNIKTGKFSKPFGIEYYFASAYAEGDTLYVFATSRHDDKEMTMYLQEDGETWHDPRGGHTVRMFKTKDLETWEEKDIITCPDRRLWNTSVCKGDGKYMMAVEVCCEDGIDIPEVGCPFTCFFAESQDLENWTMLPDSYAYTPKRYNACPALRYSRGWYYMICLEALPCQRYAPYIYRTRNFEDWFVGFHNPIMMYGDDDRVVREGASFTEEELDVLYNHLNINCSDIDLFEYEGKTHIFYANGDQMGYSFLCEVECDMLLDDFLEAFFK